MPALGLASAGPTVEVTMKDNGYHFLSGSTSGTLTPGFSMAAGEENTIILKNEDSTAHEFVSKAFGNMDVVKVGEAEAVTDGMATGWRVMPGNTVKLKVTPKVGENFGGTWDVFYCPIHGKANMKGEVIVADSRTGTGAF